nr:MAG TPA: hypothetical protein [Caudoviricetes sp.]
MVRVRCVFGDSFCEIISIWKPQANGLLFRTPIPHPKYPHLDYTRLAVYNGSCERETLTVENSIVEGR